LRLAYPNLIIQGPRTQKMVFLTFDDGPHPDYTPQVLEILDRYKAPATFFLIGERAHAHQLLIQQIHSQGHIVGNHSFSHRRFYFRSASTLEEELLRTERILVEATGEKPSFFRPPYGHFDWKVPPLLRKHSYSLVLWSLYAGDFESHMSASAIRDRVIQKIHPGAIILLHDYSRNALNLIQSLPSFLEELLERGYRFGRLDSLESDERHRAP